MPTPLTDFEIRVMEMIIAGDAEETTLRRQISKALAVSRDYSGSGLFVSLTVDESASRLTGRKRYIEQTPKVFLEHPKSKHGGGAMLWLDDGRLSMLECYAYDGFWPKDESKFTVHANAIDEPTDES